MHPSHWHTFQIILKLVHANRFSICELHVRTSAVTECVSRQQTTLQLSSKSLLAPSNKHAIYGNSVVCTYTVSPTPVRMYVRISFIWAVSSACESQTEFQVPASGRIIFNFHPDITRPYSKFTNCTQSLCVNTGILLDSVWPLHIVCCSYLVTSTSTCCRNEACTLHKHNSLVLDCSMGFRSGTKAGA